MKLNKKLKHKIAVALLVVAPVMIVVLAFWSLATPKVPTVFAEVNIKLMKAEIEMNKSYSPFTLKFEQYIRSECQKKGVDFYIVLGLIETESDYNPACISDGGESFGLMQIQPKWHYDRMQKLNATYLLDPSQNVKVGIDLLGDLIAKYGLEGGLQAYNRGRPERVPGKINYCDIVMSKAARIKEEGR